MVVKAKLEPGHSPAKQGTLVRGFTARRYVEHAASGTVVVSPRFVQRTERAWTPTPLPSNRKHRHQHHKETAVGGGERGGGGGGMS